MPDDRNNSNLFTNPTTSNQKIELEFETYQIKIPTLGRVYDSPELKDQEAIEVMPMMAAQENILRNETLIKNNTAITEMIKSSLVNKKINFNSLTMGDRNALLFNLRVTGYGDSYEPKVTCPKCGKDQNLEGFQITEGLETTFFKEENFNRVGINEFAFLLPITKKTITFKLWTGEDEEYITAVQKERKKKGLTNDSPVTQRLTQQIQSLEGIRDKLVIDKFCRHLPAGDSLAFRTYLNKVEPGVTLKTHFTCNNEAESCNYSISNFSVPLGPTFFWPELADKI